MSTPSASQSQVVFGDRRRPVSAPGDDAINPWEVLRGIWARKEIAIGTAILILVLSLIWISTVTPTYTAEALLRIEPRAGEISRFDDLSPLSPPDQGTVESEIQELFSYTLIADLVREAKLDQTSEFNPTLRKPGFLSSLLSPDKKRETPMAEMVDRVRGNLSVYRKAESRVISITFTSEKAERSALVANTLARLFIEKQIEARQALHNSATHWLREQITLLQDEVRKSEAAVESFRAQHGLFSTGGSNEAERSTTLPQREMTELSSQLVQAEAAYSEAQARLKLARELADGRQDVDTVAEVLNNDLIQNLRQQEVQLQAQIAEMSATLLPSHPRMQQAAANLKDLHGRIESEVGKIASALENEAEIARTRVNTIRANLNRLKGRMGALNQNEVELRALERQAAANRQLLESFLKRYEEASARIEADARAADARVISTAETPVKPGFPQKSALLVIAIAASLFGGVIVAFLVQVLAPGFQTPEQVERTTGTPFLGMVPEADGAAPLDTLTSDPVYRPSSAFSESLRALLGHVMTAQVAGRPARSVTITSSLKGEGKTALALGLARTAALGGRRVILVEANLYAPAVHAALRDQARWGLSEILTGRASFEHVIHRDRLSTAHILQAGAPLANPTAALGSDRMSWILSALAQTYDYVIVDTPALTEASDAQILSRQTDVTVLAVQWRRTGKRAVSRAIKQLAAATSRRVGTVLTRINRKAYRALTEDSAG